MLEPRALFHASDERDDPPVSNSQIDLGATRIALYGDISLDTLRGLVPLLNRKQSELLCSADPVTGNIPVLWIHLLSEGGDLFVAFALHDILHSLKVPVGVVVEGLCGSAALLVAMAGRQRYICPNAFVLIHQLSSVSYGKYSDLQDEMELYRKMMIRIKDIFVRSTSLTSEQVDKFLSRETWLTAEEAVALGIFHHLLGGTNDR